MQFEDVNGNKTPKAIKPSYSLPSFYKKQILNHLIRYGCSEESLEKVVSRFPVKVKKDEAIGFLNESSRLAEKYLYQECSSSCFDNIEAWLRVLKTYNFFFPTEAFADYLNEIASTEEMPKPEELNGINISDAYRFLSNAMLGLPQPPLDEATTDFLTSELEALIEEVNNEKGDEAAYKMYEKLEKFSVPDTNVDKLDPLGLG